MLYVSFMNRYFLGISNNINFDSNFGISNFQQTRELKSSFL